MPVELEARATWVAAEDVGGMGGPASLGAGIALEPLAAWEPK